MKKLLLLMALTAMFGISADAQKRADRSLRLNREWRNAWNSLTAS